MFVLAEQLVSLCCKNSFIICINQASEDAARKKKSPFCDADITSLVICFCSWTFSPDVTLEEPNCCLP